VHRLAPHQTGWPWPGWHHSKADNNNSVACRTGTNTACKSCTVTETAAVSLLPFCFQVNMVNVVLSCQAKQNHQATLPRGRKLIRVR
jgi:hypothetical protein